MNDGGGEGTCLRLQALSRSGLCVGGFARVLLAVKSGAWYLKNVRPEC